MTLRRGVSSPFARNASSISIPITVSDGDRLQGWLVNSANLILRRRVPGIVQACNHQGPVVEQDFVVQIRFRRLRHAAKDKIDAALAQIAVNLSDCTKGSYLNGNHRIFCVDTFDDGWKQSPQALARQRRPAVRQ